MDHSLIVWHSDRKSLDAGSSSLGKAATVRPMMSPAGAPRPQVVHRERRESPQSNEGRALQPGVGQADDSGCARLRNIRPGAGEDLRQTTSTGAAARLLGEKERWPERSTASPARVRGEGKERQGEASGACGEKAEATQHIR